MVLVVRIRDPVGMHRLAFGSGSASWAELQQQVEDVTRVPVAAQRLSRRPLHNPEWISPRPGDSLDAIKIANGDLLYLEGHTEQTIAAEKAARTASSSSSSSGSGSSSSAATMHIPAHKLTPRCQHGPRGACPHCMGAEPGRENEIRGKCTHGPGAVCIHCSATVKAAGKDLPTWLCTHPDSVFCPKCIPPESEEEKLKPMACDCDRAKGQECSRCMPTRPTVKVDKIPFARWLDDKRAMCKFKHGDAVTCPMCIPPELPSFTGKKNCDKGHQPWPAGVCLSCAPPNANIRVQPYRHCDSVSIYPSVMQPFYSNWLRSGSVFQRAAILFGRYVDEPAETNNPGAIRAVVHALYEPPQENSKSFVRFLRDPHEKLMHELAAKLQLDVVGWAVTTTERAGDKYGGPVFMSGLEVQQAARFQWRYRNQHGYSRFVSLVLERPADAAAGVEPRAYQVSDLAVCLERDGVFALADDPNMLCTRVPRAGEMVPSVVYKDRPLLPGKEFLPDELLVKVNALAPRSESDRLLRHAEFPPLKDNPSDAMWKGWLKKYAAEDYLGKLSDFNLLAYAYAKQTLPAAALDAVCSAIANQTQIDNKALAVIDAQMMKQGLI